MSCQRVTGLLQKLSRNSNKILPALSQARECSSRSDVDKVTHTGQVFEKDDYRNVRFTNATRYVNDNWGINLIDEIPPKEVTERVVYCDGGDGQLGHPKVYINLELTLHHHHKFLTKIFKNVSLNLMNKRN